MYTNKKIITNGYRLASQIPLDDRLVVADLVELADLGTDDFKAYQYYEGMIVFVLSDGSMYKWVEDSSGNGLIGGFTYPANITTTDVDYSNRIFDFVEIEIGLPTKIITYADLLTLYSNAQLTIGRKYIISDFATKHVIPNSGGTINTGVTESLEVQAISINKLSLVAKSPSYPQDIIHYEIIDTSTAGGDKGRIYYREDSKTKISTHYDWRNVKFRRFRNAQTLNFTAGASLNQAGLKISGGTSGAIGYVIGGTGANILRIVNVSGVFVNGEVVTAIVSGATRTITTVADYNSDTDTYVSNGRASSDVYTFVDITATGMYNIKLGPMSAAGDKLNNVTFLAGSYNVQTESNCYNCVMSLCTNVTIKSDFYNNYFRGSFGSCLFQSSASGNNVYGSFSNNVFSGTFLSNSIAGLFNGNNLIGYYFGLNTIEYDFQYNTIVVRITGSTISTNSVRYNNFYADIQSETFLSTATMVTQFHTKRIIEDSTGVLRLEYHDGLTLVYVDPLTA